MNPVVVHRVPVPKVRVRFHSFALTDAVVDALAVRWTRAKGWECACGAASPCEHVRAVERLVERGPEDQ